MSESFALKYRTFGDGKPVVFIHGALSDQRTWFPFAAQIGAAGFKAIAYSQRYFEGQWFDNGENYTLKRHQQDFFDLLQRLQIERYTAVAWSWGASIAISAALLQPDRVEKLILYEPGGPPLSELAPSASIEERNSVLSDERFSKIKQDIDSGNSSKAAKALIEYLYQLGPDSYDEVVTSFATREIHEINARQLKLLYNVRDRIDGSSLAQLSIPTIIGYGAESEIARFKKTRKALLELIPNSAEQELPGCNHGAPSTRPKVFLQWILRNLKTCGTI